MFSESLCLFGINLDQPSIIFCRVFRVDEDIVQQPALGVEESSVKAGSPG
jgi:hypothetical protein